MYHDYEMLVSDRKCFRRCNLGENPAMMNRACVCFVFYAIYMMLFQVKGI